MTSPHRRNREQLIGVLVPTPLPDRPRPRPAPMPALPVPRPLDDLSEGEVLIGVARPDLSGRLTERGPLRALGWSPGHRIDIHPHGEMLVIASAVAGQHVVGSRGELPLPASARQMCAITPGQRLLLAALISHDLLVIHPASAVTRLLADLHAEIIGSRHAG